MQIKWLQEALRGLDEIEAYILGDSPAAAVDVIIKIIETVSLLKNQQSIGRIGHVPGTKELVVAGASLIALRMAWFRFYGSIKAQENGRTVCRRLNLEPSPLFYEFPDALEFKTVPKN